MLRTCWKILVDFEVVVYLETGNQLITCGHCLNYIILVHIVLAICSAAIFRPVMLIL